MNPQTVITIGREALTMVLLISSPLLIAALVVGVTISIFQAITSIQEMTLTFIPKIVAVALALLIFLPWMLNMATDFARHMFELIPTLVG
ncbi:MAG TPA: flagellar biosynthesis protein FliQ [candidate division Zixibacteria bacterium]|nr:flagellar biosynthesis protein FliQ [candidate division Zixibacteria bacterium]